MSSELTPQRAGEPALSARGLGKTYQLYDRPVDRLRQMLARGGQRYYREFPALQGVSFELGQGEVLGLVGRNGAGKSTLLQLICGTLTPSEGSVAVAGRVAALLELGAGFNPDFTGRENVYLNASILGLSRAEIDERYDDMVAFSGIGDFIHQPVKTYSSGMYVRLAFSIATSVDPNILIIDEALSVGDGAFARKSFDRIMQLKAQGATILFCSHSMYQIEALCTRALWLEKGVVQQMGEPARVVAAYQDFLDRDSAPSGASGASGHSAPVPQGHARILAVQTSVDGVAATSLPVMSEAQTLAVRIGFASDPALPAPAAAVTLNAPDGRILASSSTQIDGLPLARDEAGRGTATIEFPRIPLLKGEYFVWVYLLSEDGIHIYDTASNVANLHFSQRGLEQGVVALAHGWRSEAGAEAPVVRTEWAPVLSQDPVDQLGRAAGELAAGEALMDVQGRIASEHPALSARFGLAPDEQGKWRLQRAPRWQPVWVGVMQLPAWDGLFTASFGYAMSPLVRQWKYRDVERLGMGVRRGDELVAFYGGMPRPVSYFGQPATAVQIGDVMVHPGERGVLTRSGPFQMAAATFLEQQIGHGRPYLIGFGFPEDKAMRLAERLGLYAQVDAMTELRWPALAPRAVWNVYARPLGTSSSGVVDALWEEMKTTLPESIVGVRDGAFVQGRYLDHPMRPYSVLLVRRRFTGSVVGVVVVRDRLEQGVELVDFIAPPERFKELLGVARRYAGHLGRAEVFTWITASHADRLADENSRRVPLNLLIPANIWSHGPDVSELRDRWWLMGGDTDFR